VYHHTRTVYTSPDTIYTSPATEGYTTYPSSVVVTPPSATDQAFHDGLAAGRAEAVTIAGGAYFLYDRLIKPTFWEDEDEGFWEEEDEGATFEEELSETRAVMSELKAEFEATDPLVSRIQAPPSGRYEGDSAEDDEGDQSVITHLTFEGDGRVQGWGNDGVDGAYVIKEGRWSSTPDVAGGARVAWIEKYDDGFEVALRGQVRKSDGAILGMWASTRGVSGSVKLDLRPPNQRPSIM